MMKLARAILLPSSRVRALLRLSGEIFEIVKSAGNPAPHAADGLGKLVSADCVGLVLGSGEPGENMVRMVLAGVPDDTAHEIETLYMCRHGSAVDPAGRAIARQGTRVALRRELVDDRSWYRSEFVRDYRRRWRLDDSIYAVFPRGTEVAGVGCFRAWGARPFGDVERELVDIFLKECGSVLLPGLNPTPLSRREQEVLAHLLSGGSAKDIARALRISVNTVNQYIREVYRAKQVSTRGELLAQVLKTPRR
jgi:DNA-binding CsgD family transcriptional regulator